MSLVLIAVICQGSVHQIFNDEYREDETDIREIAVTWARDVAAQFDPEMTPSRAVVFSEVVETTVWKEVCPGESSLRMFTTWKNDETRSRVYNIVVNHYEKE